MEKQLLFLLDWDLRINPQDLYTHLEPFLAPIRIQLQQREERYELRRIAAIQEKQAAVQQLPSPSSSQQSLVSDPYDSPNYSSDLERFSTRAQQTRRPTSTTRLRSISPPSAECVPGLTRAMSCDTPETSSRSSSISPPPSRMGGTPASSLDTSPYAYIASAAVAEPEVAFSYPYSNPRYEDGTLEGESMYRLRQPSYSQASEEKPAKKAKLTGGVGGSIISRFLSSATSGYERRGARAVV